APSRSARQEHGIRGAGHSLRSCQTEASTARTVRTQPTVRRGSGHPGAAGGRSSATVIIADTNVVSELFRPTPAPQVVTWLESTSDVTITSVTVGEIWAGIENLPDGRRK